MRTEFVPVPVEQVVEVYETEYVEVPVDVKTKEIVEVVREVPVFMEPLNIRPAQIDVI